MADAAHLAVARIRKPHGLHGELVAWVLTDDPDRLFAAGRHLTPIDEAGDAVDEPVVVERSRAYQRQWLLKLAGVDDRSTAEGWRERLLGVARETLSPPRDDELYFHEIPGAVVRAGGETIGVARELLEAPGGTLLSIDVNGREILVPFRAPLLKRIVRAERAIELELPDGLLDL
ncbi:MAG TPA: ribosome maturation factor RimM [Gemmatimonadales bacterium]|jgi:16S rRNA processing protein RimM